MRRPLCLACLAVAAFIVVRLHFFPEEFPDLSAFHRTRVVVAGIVSGKEWQQGADGRVLQLTLKDATLEGADGGTAGNASYGILCLADWPAAQEEADLPAAGSRVRVRGRLYVPEQAGNPGQFDQAVYYRCQGIDAVLRNASLEEVSARRGGWLDEGLFRVRSFLGEVLDQSLNEEDAGILKAMLLGSKGDLSDEIRTLYKESGIIHILAISGLHISMLGMGLWKLLRRCRLPLPVCCAASTGFMLLYGRMTGMSASSFRAVFMFVLQMAARMIHRTYDLLTAVSLAAVLLLVQEPLYWYNSGFLFSFGAVLAIGLLAPELRDIKPAALQVPLAVTLVTLPVYLQYGGTFPLYSILLNLVVLPLMSAVMVCGLGLLACGSVWRACRMAWLLPGIPVVQAAVREGTGSGFCSAAVAGGGFVPGIPVHLLLWFYRNLCTLVARLPGHSLVLGQTSSGRLAIYYGLLLAVPALSSHIPSVVQKLFLVGALTLILQRNVPGLAVDVVDVGQGDGILVTADITGTGQTGWNSTGLRLMIDGGSTSTGKVGQYRLVPFLCARGVGRINLWIVTHGDEDHTSGLIEMLEDADCPIAIDRIAVPSCADSRGVDAAGANLSGILELAAARGIPVSTLCAGEEILCRTGARREQELQLTCLHPGKGAAYEDPNEYSVTLLAEYGAFSALLTGDLEGEGEKDLLAYLGQLKQEKQQAARLVSGDENSLPAEKSGGEQAEPRRITLLKVAHHGSGSATTADFLKAIRPEVAVISCGRNNRYHHPHPDTVARLSAVGSRLYDTRFTGEIRFRTNGRRLWIRSWKKP